MCCDMSARVRRQYVGPRGLGLIALEDFNDLDAGPRSLRMGALPELAERAFPPGFSGRLPQHRAANQPF